MSVILLGDAHSGFSFQICFLSFPGIRCYFQKSQALTIRSNDAISFTCEIRSYSHTLTVRNVFETIVCYTCYKMSLLNSSQEPEGE